MTREEAIQYLNKLYTRAELTDVYGDMEDMTPYEEALDMAIQALEQEPCSDAQERYEDLCEYFGDAKDILKNRKDFKAWLERIKWHINKAEELYEKYECKEPCTDAISRKDALSDEGLGEFHFFEDYIRMRNYLKNLPSVNPQEPKTGEWIADVDGYTCSECGVFNTDDDNFCPNCGADMRGEEVDADSN